MSNTTWAGGSRIFYAALRDMSDAVLGGTLVTIDPSIGSRDSQPGYAVFYKGTRQVSGTVAIDWRETSYRRVAILLERVQTLLPSPPDVLGIEQISKAMPGNSKLLWAVGVTIAGAAATQTIEIPITFWKSYARDKPGYVKGDEQDAIAMGEAMIAYCREVTGND